MIETLGFITSRTGILLLASIIVSALLAWGFSLKIDKVELEKRIVVSERNYQARISDALEKQRIAFGKAAIHEQQRKTQNEKEWKITKTKLKNEADYENSAPISVVSALNSLSDRTASNR